MSSKVHIRINHHIMGPLQIAQLFVLKFKLKNTKMTNLISSLVIT